MEQAQALHDIARSQSILGVWKHYNI